MPALQTLQLFVATAVAVANRKLYLDRAEGFMGWSLRGFEQVDECSEIDDIIVFRDNGTMLVTKVADKKFIGKGVLHIAVWKKNDERTIYHLIYQDGAQGASFMKRFAVTSITRDKDYDLTNGTKGSKVLYFTANPDGASETVRINLRPRPNLRKTQFDVDFGDLMVKGRGSKGNLLTRYMVHKVTQKERGGSTLGAIPIWFDETVRRLNESGHGRYLGRFSGDDKILAILSTGHYQLFPFALGTHFPDQALTLVKWDPETAITAVYWEGEKQQYNVKRFLVEPARDPVHFITDHPDSKLTLHTLVRETGLHIAFDKRSNDREDEDVHLAEFIAVKGVKALGNRLTPYKVKEMKLTGDVFTVMTPELEEKRSMLITEDEIGQLEPPEEEGLERSPMEEYRKSHKPEKSDDPDQPIIGAKPGKQMDLGLD